MRDVRSVLLVDDEPDIRTIGELSLGRVGRMDVLLAASGQEALTVLETFTPDVILLDMMMPGMDGVATYRRLRRQPGLEKVPVIFVTARVQDQDVKRYLELGAAGVVQKPFDPMALPEQVRSIVAGYQG